MAIPWKTVVLEVDSRIWVTAEPELSATVVNRQHFLRARVSADLLNSGEALPSRRISDRPAPVRPNHGLGQPARQSLQARKSDAGKRHGPVG